MGVTLVNLPIEIIQYIYSFLPGTEQIHARVNTLTRDCVESQRPLRHSYYRYVFEQNQLPYNYRDKIKFLKRMGVHPKNIVLHLSNTDEYIEQNFSSVLMTYNDKPFPDWFEMFDNTFIHNDDPLTHLNVVGDITNPIQNISNLLLMKSIQKSIVSLELMYINIGSNTDIPMFQNLTCLNIRWMPFQLDMLLKCLQLNTLTIDDCTIESICSKNFIIHGLPTLKHVIIQNSLPFDITYQDFSNKQWIQNLNKCWIGPLFTGTSFGYINRDDV